MKKKLAIELKDLKFCDKLMNTHLNWWYDALNIYKWFHIFMNESWYLSLTIDEVFWL